MVCMGSVEPPLVVLRSQRFATKLRLHRHQM